MDAALNDNNTKLGNLEKALKAANERRRKLIERSKLITYDTLAKLYGIEGQELIDAVTAEHELVAKLTSKGMSFEELADNSSANAEQQMSFSDKRNPYED